MMPSRPLVVVAADNSIKAVVEALLRRSHALGICDISKAAKIDVHPNFDSATFRGAHELLRDQSSVFDHALVICDREGAGVTLSREQMELDIECRLAQSGWGNRAAAVVIDPELDMWVWQRNPHVATAINWKEGIEDLYRWLQSEGYLTVGSKPANPKKALNAALYRARVPKSAAVFDQLASRVSFQSCTDPAFLKLVQTLRRWFPPQSQTVR